MQLILPKLNQIHLLLASKSNKMEIEEDYQKVLHFATEAHKGQIRRNKIPCPVCKNWKKEAKFACSGPCKGKGYFHEDYIVHPIGVSKIAEKIAHRYITLHHDQFYGEDPPRNGAGLVYTVRDASLVHDVIEDTEHTKDDVERVCGREIADIVEWVTRADDKEYFLHIHSLVVFGPLEAKILKIADLTYNLVDAEGNVAKNKIQVYKLSKYLLERDLGLEP